MKRIVVFFLFCSTLLTSCLYQMPEDDRICILPNVNNPMLTREQPSSITPKM